MVEGQAVRHDEHVAADGALQLTCRGWEGSEGRGERENEGEAAELARWARREARREPRRGEELYLSVSRARTELLFFVSSAYSSQICILYKIIERERNRGGGKEDTGAKKNKT